MLALSMTRTLPLTILLLLASFLCLSAGDLRTVIIDPGHGGKDAGGKVGSVEEKHLALDTALRLEKYLEARGLDAILTRRSDTFISLEKRAEINSKYRDAVFVSIHYNYTWRRQVHGVETFYYDERSKYLAGLVQSAMVKRVKAEDRRIKRARFHVLRYGKKNPSILVEGGFISNRSERGKLKSASYRQKVAEGIGQGIFNYKSLRDQGKLR